MKLNKPASDGAGRFTWIETAYAPHDAGRSTKRRKGEMKE
jgi:hypothetical protein